MKILGIWIYTDIQNVMKMNSEAIFKKLYLVTKDGDIDLQQFWEGCL